jgi:hypothetical protein
MHFWMKHFDYTPSEWSSAFITTASNLSRYIAISCVYHASPL